MLRSEWYVRRHEVQYPPSREIGSWLGRFDCPRRCCYINPSQCDAAKKGEPGSRHFCRDEDVGEGLAEVSCAWRLEVYQEHKAQLVTAFSRCPPIGPRPVSRPLILVVIDCVPRPWRWRGALHERNIDSIVGLNRPGRHINCRSEAKCIYFRFHRQSRKLIGFRENRIRRRVEQDCQRRLWSIRLLHPLLFIR